MTARKLKIRLMRRVKSGFSASKRAMKDDCKTTSSCYVLGGFDKG
jgi:hypothetical protein